jgi:hypothetical protein
VTVGGPICGDTSGSVPVFLSSRFTNKIKYTVPVTPRACHPTASRIMVPRVRTAFGPFPRLGRARLPPPYVGKNPLNRLSFVKDAAAARWLPFPPTQNVTEAIYDVLVPSLLSQRYFGVDCVTFLLRFDCFLPTFGEVYAINKKEIRQKNKNLLACLRHVTTKTVWQVRSDGTRVPR